MRVRPGTIHISRLVIETTLGATAAERAAPQQVEIAITIDVDLAPAATTDRLADTIDYTTVRDRVLAVVAGASHHLLESLAVVVLNAVIDDARVLGARVCVTKPRAMRLADAVSVSVSWQRTPTAP